MMLMIERAARDPSVDIEKMKQLMEMLKAVQAEEAEAAFNTAMADVQSQIKRIVADKDNTQTKSKYASYAAMDRAIKPIYTGAGFAISFNEDVGAAGPDMVRVLAYVTHTAPGAKRSHTRIYNTDVPADGKGAKGGDVMTKTHAHMSGVTYGKRGLLGMIFNLAIGNDDDGNAAGDTDAQAITVQHLKELRALIVEVKADEAKVCKACRVDALEDLTVKLYQQAKAKLESMRSPL
ncbi:ERF family protein [Bradyrhizobium sp. Ai1a-2]|uniref:ERF family protein n=1 Tax=Bradyrhizobium sp. Ai1a-2 TaxID=196490 RepID=UPI000406A260|nr:ERF family protein [Bradyrhizobium sp. Ai1a-2]